MQARRLRVEEARGEAELVDWLGPLTEEEVELDEELVLLVTDDRSLSSEIPLIGIF